MNVNNDARAKMSRIIGAKNHDHGAARGLRRKPLSRDVILSEAEGSLIQPFD
jgi:hypothetical protein